MNETALKERLKVIAAERRITFNQCWKKLLLERFLVRVSQSPYNAQFTFKGGLLLGHYLKIGRETVDIDFSISKMNVEADWMTQTMKEIAQVSTGDGFSFEFDTIEELTQAHMQHVGYRIDLRVKLEKMKDKIQIDVGFGDPVDIHNKTIRLFQYRGKPLFEDEISIQVYPPEFIFAEKLHALVTKAEFNSRMKDYHDLLLMSREPSLISPPKLKTAIQKTFGSRDLTLQRPIGFPAEDMARLQKLWALHMKGLADIAVQLKLPNEVASVLSELNAWLENHHL